MKNRHACTVIEERAKSIVVQLPNEEQLEIAKDLLTFEALVGDEVWISLNTKGKVTQVGQKDFSRGYGVLDEIRGGEKIELYVSPARELQ